MGFSITLTKRVSVTWSGAMKYRRDAAISAQFGTGSALMAIWRAARPAGRKVGGVPAVEPPVPIFENPDLSS